MADAGMVTVGSGEDRARAARVTDLFEDWVAEIDDDGLAYAATPETFDHLVVELYRRGFASVTTQQARGRSPALDRRA